MEILKKVYSQYEVYIEGLELNSKKAIIQKIKIMKFYDSHKYEAIFNIGYRNDKSEVVVMRAFGKNEDEAMKNLENIILENKIKFKKEY